MFGIQSHWHKPGLSYLWWPFCLSCSIYYISLLDFLLGFFSILPVKPSQIHMFFGLFASHCATKTRNAASKLNFGILLGLGQCKKPCKIRYAHHHHHHWSPPHPTTPAPGASKMLYITFPHLFFQLAFFPPQGQFQTSGYGSAEL